MGLIGGYLGYTILKAISEDGETAWMDGSAYNRNSKLDVLLGTDFTRTIEGKSVIDFGCGLGGEAVEMAQRGASRVIGVDIDQSYLDAARGLAERMGVSNKCQFTDTTTERADVIVSLDAFEHFLDPAGVLVTMRELLKPDGYVLAAFGPTWYHPLGGHMFSVFPWAHFVFTGRALLQWRSTFKQDQATTLGEVGLNKMTIRKFEQLVEQSPFRFAEFKLMPIRKLRLIANRLTRELTTSVVRCKLIPRH
jgi:SAM-dependent methyltransferase